MYAVLHSDSDTDHRGGHRDYYALAGGVEVRARECVEICKGVSVHTGIEDVLVCGYVVLYEKIILCWH